VKIHRLTLAERDGSGGREWSFPGGVCRVGCDDPETLLSAFALLLCPGSAPPKRGGAKIRAEIEAGGTVYRVSLTGKKLSAGAKRSGGEETEGTVREYLSLLRRCPEEDRLCFFPPADGDDFDPETYLRAEEPGRLLRGTAGMAATESFRRCLKSSLLSSPAPRGATGPLLSYLETVRFWDRFGRLRDLHYEGKPLLIRLPRVPPEAAALCRAFTDRQIVFLESPPALLAGREDGKTT